MSEPIRIGYKNDLASICSALRVRSDLKRAMAGTQLLFDNDPLIGKTCVIESLADVIETYRHDPSSLIFLEYQPQNHIALFRKDFDPAILDRSFFTFGTAGVKLRSGEKEFLRKALPSGKIENREFKTVEIDPSRFLFQGDVQAFFTDDNPQDQYYLQHDLQAAFLGVVNEILLEPNLDGLILSPSYASVLSGVVMPDDFRWMVLPLFEFSPRLGEGYTVLQQENSSDAKLRKLRSIDNIHLRKRFETELELVNSFDEKEKSRGFHVHSRHIYFTYASGSIGDKISSRWTLDIPPINPKHIFSGTDFMKGFFGYQNYHESPELDRFNVFFIASHKALHNESLQQRLRDRRVWAAGARTWSELAKMGIWVEGSADALGLEFALDVMQSAPSPVSKSRICILTNKASTEHWVRDGWNAFGTYELEPVEREEINLEIKRADFLFWTSFQQYEVCKHLVKPGAIHASAAGKTASLLREEGLNPVVFPTIKAFEYWRKGLNRT